MKIDPNAPAHPHQYIVGINGSMADAGAIGGLTIRAHLAAMAMQGLCPEIANFERLSHLTEDAVKIADALIAELNKETKQ